jgi:hypothetical protein
MKARRDESPKEKEAEEFVLTRSPATFSSRLSLFRIFVIGLLNCTRAGIPECEVKIGNLQ